MQVFTGQNSINFLILPPTYKCKRESECKDNVINSPHLLNWLFTERTERFVKYWLKNTLGATRHWFRYEYDCSGSIHWNGVAKLSNDPNLCKLSKKAIEGYLALKSLKHSSEMSKKDRQHAVEEGQKAESYM